MGISILYIFGAALAIIGFHFIVPGEAVPLPFFSFSWRLVRGFLAFLGLFPALALTALVIPFGFKIQPVGKEKRFSAEFFQSLKSSIITAIVLTALFGILSSLIAPIARNYEANLRFQGQLYHIAKDLAFEHAGYGDWERVSHYIAFCEGIWPGGPEHSKLRIEANIQNEGARVARLPPPSPLEQAASQFRGTDEVLTSADALNLAEAALNDERYFDAHWLATLAGRLARPGSAEIAEADRLAGRAWQGVISLEPNAAESRAHAIYRLKREGHIALLGDEWIRAYYIFLELVQLTPQDPDAIRYLAMSERGVHQVAFFIDEIELSLGSLLTGAIFSLPFDSGRMVMRLSSLSTFTDTAYGMEADIMAFDAAGRPLWSLSAPYAKIFPFALDSGPAVAVLLRAIDRTDRSMQWEPVFRSHNQAFSAGRADFVLAISWEDFLLLSSVRRGLSGLSPAELRTAANDLGRFGYQSRVFEAELLRRFLEPLILLPLGIIAIITGWRYRPLKRPRYMGIPMLGIMPVVFNGAISFCLIWLNKLGIWAVVSFGFGLASVFFGVFFLVFLLVSLITLAAQK
ncbi:MAG: hypothetical protein FWH19_04150 [Treponema sp.]|nr:hypothetical protein [Treponema sp.]